MSTNNSDNAPLPPPSPSSPKRKPPSSSSSSSSLLSTSPRSLPKSKSSPSKSKAAESLVTTPPSSPKSKRSIMTATPPPAPKSPTKSSPSSSPSLSSSSQRPYSLYWNKPVRKYSHNRNSSMRQKSLNLQKMSTSISQNLIDMKYKKRGQGYTNSDRNIVNDGDSVNGQAAAASTALQPPYLQQEQITNNHHREAQVPREHELPTLPPSQTSALTQSLNTFLTHHLSFHRPVALVTSGGTITTLEKNTIRYLDNFSTGQRGAISVEEFCKRGYAVVHLWREGSTAPYSRVLSKLLGCRKGNCGLGPDALGLLFEGQQQQQHHQNSIFGRGGATGELKVEDDDSGGNDNGRPSNTEAKQQQHHDPWLTTTHRSQSHRSVNSDIHPDGNININSTTTNGNNNIHNNNDKKYSSQNRMNLTTHVLHNNLLERKLRERADVVANNLLYTIPFTTIEEYIALLKIATEAMNQCQSLGLIYLAAAVSDFYIPEEDKCVHKIQSRDYGIVGTNKDKGDIDKTTTNTTGPPAIVMNQVDNTLSLTMQPVPKVIQLITQKWSPHAFCVSFKLETDETILRKKVHQAMNKYNVQLIVGNVLDTRHDKVSLFEQKRSDDFDHDGDDKDDVSIAYDGMKVTEVTKSNRYGNGGDDDDDELEDNIISNVVEKHFEYIANHYLIEDGSNNSIGGIYGDDDDDDLESIGGGEGKNILPRTALMTGAEAAARHNAYMRKQKEALKREMHWKRLRDVSLNVAGHAVGCFLTYTLSSIVQTYLH